MEKHKAYILEEVQGVEIGFGSAQPTGGEWVRVTRTTTIHMATAKVAPTNVLFCHLTHRIALPRCEIFYLLT